MPSSTFLNLPVEKQEKLMEAATREFSTKPFNEASINRIIKDAGIPRGSFYMYFEDKESLFRYLFQRYEEQMMAIVESLLERSRGDIFATLLGLYDYARQEGAGHPGEMDVLSGIFRCNHGLQKSGVLDLMDPDTILQRLGGAVDTRFLDLRREEDLTDMLRILLAVSVPAIYEGLQTGGPPDGRARLENTLTILRRGMGRTAETSKQ